VFHRAEQPRGRNLSTNADIYPADPIFRESWI